MFPTRELWQQSLAQRHGEKAQASISGAVVAICGLGGLGSSIAVHLARAGIGRLILIDFDCVDMTNLHRQQYKVSQVGMSKTEALRENLLEISPYTELVTHRVKLTEGNIGTVLDDADIVCEAFDEAGAKAMLVNYVLEHCPEAYMVAASGMAGFGSANSITTRKISKRFYLCGDGISDVGDGIGLVSSRVAICAAHQAHTVLRILTNQFDV